MPLSCQGEVAKLVARVIQPILNRFDALPCFNGGRAGNSTKQGLLADGFASPSVHFFDHAAFPAQFNNIRIHDEHRRPERKK